MPKPIIYNKSRDAADQLKEEIRFRRTGRHYRAPPKKCENSVRSSYTEQCAKPPEKKGCEAGDLFYGFLDKNVPKNTTEVHDHLEKY